MARPDNVTPFRPRKPQRPQRPQGQRMGLATHRGRAVLVHVLTLLSFSISMFGPALAAGAGAGQTTLDFISLFGLAIGLAALFIAAGNRRDAMPWAATHHEHAVRTLVIAVSVWTLANLLGLVGLGVATPYIKLAVFIWVTVRASIGLVLAILRRPIWRPKGFLV